LKIATFALWPFGREIVSIDEAGALGAVDTVSVSSRR